ncbi:MAG: type VI secretion system baseplate subunit TssG [Planctomycetota bacterium]|nr:type VI secretion system baseplate subunit TssG [Planctomycetota bacterium]
MPAEPASTTDKSAREITQVARRVSRDKRIDELLEEAPYRFEFFQAVRLLARMFRDRDPVGRQSVPRNEIVRFRAHQSLEFPASQIQSAKFDTEPGHPVELHVNFMGMTGPIGALPQWYTETVVQRMAMKDHTLREFLDIFNHRLISLFYRAWEKYRFWLRHEDVVQQEANALKAGEAKQRGFVIDERPALDRFSQCLLELTGAGPPSIRYQMQVRNRLEPRHEIRDETLRFYAGLLAQSHRSAVALEAILTDYFQVPVAIRQFQGQWLVLDESERTKIGKQNRRLGRETVVGRRVWDAQSKFRVQVGPLTYQEFQRLIPVGDAHRPLTEFVRFYVGPEFDFDVELVLLADEVPQCRLGSGALIRAALGWNTWSILGKYNGDAASVVLVVNDEDR